MGNKSKREVIDKVVQLDTIFNLEYLNLVIMGALRIQAPATTTTIMHLIKDCKLGGINVRKGDWFIINLYALHFDASQW